MVEMILNEVMDELPLDINVIDLMHTERLDNGDITVDISYPMLSDEFTQTLCFRSDSKDETVLRHIKDLVEDKYKDSLDDGYVKDKYNDFMKYIDQKIQTL